MLGHLSLVMGQEGVSGQNLGSRSHPLYFYEKMLMGTVSQVSPVGNYKWSDFRMLAAMSCLEVRIPVQVFPMLFHNEPLVNTTRIGPCWEDLQFRHRMSACPLLLILSCMCICARVQIHVHVTSSVIPEGPFTLFAETVTN